MIFSGILWGPHCAFYPLYIGVHSSSHGSGKALVVVIARVTRDYLKSISSSPLEILLE